uniref:Uncharacterized protein n=1 Tax=Oryza nivara TaxID=4536 RepID=A0A0E0G3K2_ORYNI
MEAAARLRVRLVAILVISSLLLSPPFLVPCVLAAGSSGGGSRGREMKHAGHLLVIAPRKSTWPRRVLNSGDQPNHDPIHNSPISQEEAKMKSGLAIDERVSINTTT